MLSPPRTLPTAALPPECVRASRRGIEIITLPGAQAPHAVGRTRYTEKPPAWAIFCFGEHTHRSNRGFAAGMCARLAPRH